MSLILCFAIDVDGMGNNMVLMIVEVKFYIDRRGKMNIAIE